MSEEQLPATEHGLVHSEHELWPTSVPIVVGSESKDWSQWHDRNRTPESGFWGHAVEVEMDVNLS